jgi:DNA-binding transcriptional MocR family regulator
MFVTRNRVSSVSSALAFRRNNFRPMANIADTRIQDYNPYLSVQSLQRQPSAIRSLMPLLKIPGMISLGGGMPNPSTFPFKGLTVDMANAGDGGPTQYRIEGEDIGEALQYSATPGLPSLLRHLEKIRLAFHTPRSAIDGASMDIARSTMITTGSQDALTKVSLFYFQSKKSICCCDYLLRLYLLLLLVFNFCFLCFFAGV